MSAEKKQQKKEENHEHNVSVDILSIKRAVEVVLLVAIIILGSYLFIGIALGNFGMVSFMAALCVGYIVVNFWQTREDKKQDKKLLKSLAAGGTAQKAAQKSTKGSFERLIELEVTKILSEHKDLSPKELEQELQKRLDKKMKQEEKKAK